MNLLKIGIINEGKIPPDSRVPFSPKQCRAILEQFPNVEIYVAPSAGRCFSDDEYRAAGITLKTDLSDCRILMGVKEVPIQQLIAHKKYFFFSHTIKKQAHNQKLLQALLAQNIQMVDYECLVYDNDTRILGFGHFAGIVGAHNGLLAYGRKTGLFNLKPAYQSTDYDEIKNAYLQLNLPPMRIVLTGTGRVSQGAKEVLDILQIRQVSPADYLARNYTEPVYTMLTSADLYCPKDAGVAYNRHEFHAHPERYKCQFAPFAQKTDLFINGIYWSPQAPIFFSKEEMAAPNFAIKVIADITCDMDGSVPATTRATTIADPVMGYNPHTQQEEPPYQAHTIDIMAVDNLPNELPRDASEMFGNALIKNIIPELLKPESAVINRASITKNGQLTERFTYLKEYAYPDLALL